ncbi:MAG: hypothetical protein KA738_03370, partial [Pseudoxanthomonas sp.]|nr:hypothetical protein [Ottowia sp.]MBP7597792.1 hypothetical protein [Pseudoxanthomonas sp.]MBP7655665.1 hypothetical protein [Pseudoxanthomonas sp.]
MFASSVHCGGALAGPIRLDRFGSIEGRQATRGGDRPQGFPLEGVVVLFVQIGALCSENPLHDKHLRFPHFRALRIFRADWCASS